jgi:adenylate cyclase
MKIFTSSLMVVILATILFAGRFFDVNPVETLRLKTFDYYQKASPRDITTDSVVLVEITEQDLKKYGQWPWPRNLIANLHNRIYQSGADVIQYNIIFAEKDRFGHDEKFAQKLKGTNTIMMYSVKSNKTDGPVAKVGIVKKGKPDKFLFSFEGVVTNIPELLQFANGAGVNIMIPNIDGTVRQIPLFVNTDIGTLPNQVLDTLRIINKSSRYKIDANQKGIETVFVSKKKSFDTDKNGMFNINFADVKTIKTYSVSDLISNQINLKNKIVIVGLNSAGLSYLKDTPLGLMTDAKISAQAIETALTETQLIRNGNTNLIEIVAVFVLGFLLIVIVPRLGITSTVLLYLTLLTGMILASVMAYKNFYYLLDASFPVLFITIVWGHLVFNSFAKQFRLRQQIKKQFEHYLDPRMVKKLQNDPGLLKLGGETKTMTFLFSDIRGFTPIAEKYKGNPQGLTKLINRFLTRMTNIIIKNGGTIDKFMGDCIMAFWNAPLDTPGHEKLAVKTALQMQKELKKLNRELKKEKLPQIDIGIGINTGEALVGNMGSDQRFDYSVIGDDVNLASRLESSSKELKKTLVIGEKTKKKCKGMRFTSLGKINVKGKTEDIKVFTISG